MQEYSAQTNKPKILSAVLGFPPSLASVSFLAKLARLIIVLSFDKNGKPLFRLLAQFWWDLCDPVP